MDVAAKHKRAAECYRQDAKERRARGDSKSAELCEKFAQEHDKWQAEAEKD